MLSDFKRDVAELTGRVDELRGHLDLPAKEARLAALDAEMASPAFWDDNRRAQELIRERAELARVVARVTELGGQASDLAVLLELAGEAGDDSVDAEIREGIATLRRELDEFELKVMLSGPHDAKAAILSIHPGAGGTESQDWAQMLMRMYLRWCERAGFKAEVVDLLPGEEAGIKSATIEVTGDYAYGYLKGEAGVHRLIRISPFDASSRRQTSFASVAVTPEVDDVEVTIREDELRVDVYRSSGPGGQGVNTADSAVRITHLPTGIVVACQNERSQLRNRDTALRILKARLFEVASSKQKEELSQLAGQKKEIAFGSQIRTYTFHPEQRIKDHRTGVEIGNVEAVMDGAIDEFIKAYLLWARGKG
ncbi:MAG TPA: peptide chain release factor 2 [Patescibacteria group bacterium]|nr:peptide chain release factor 2 [Patescibacteria group bacterium]